MGKMCVAVGFIGMLISGSCSLMFLGEWEDMAGMVLVFGIGPFILSLLLFKAGRKLDELGE